MSASFGDSRLPNQLWAKVELIPFSTCWWWSAAVDKDGYGLFHIPNSSKMCRVGRFIYRALVGEIPDNLQLDHFRCDNPVCVRPDHVRPVTCRENLLRGRTVNAENAAKTKCKCGRDYDMVRSNGGRACRYCRRKSDRELKRLYRRRDLNG